LGWVNRTGVQARVGFEVGVGIRRIWGVGVNKVRVYVRVTVWVRVGVARIVPYRPA